MSWAPSIEFFKKLTEQYIDKVCYSKANEYTVKLRNGKYYIFRRRYEDEPWEKIYTIAVEDIDDRKKWIKAEGAFANDRLRGQYRYYMPEDEWTVERKKRKKRKKSAK